MNKRLVAAVAVAALSLTLAACGGDDDGSDSTGGTGAASSGGGTPATLKLDTAYGTSGIATSPLNASAHDRFMAVAQASDGKTYAAGFTVTGDGDQAFAVARIDNSGKLDTTFGTGGIASVNIAVGGKAGELARAIAVQSDGKIVISGPFEKDPAGAGDAARDIDVAAARFDTTGKLDTSFGTGGVAKMDWGTGRITTGTTYIADTAWGMGIGNGGKVVLFGSTPAAGDGRVDTDFVFGAFTSAGQIDSSFGQGGKLVIDVATAANNPRHVLVQADGKILGTGYSSINGIVQPSLIRLTAAGQLDTTFGTNGVATHEVLPGVAESYAVQQQGNNYILAGYGRGADNTEKVDMIVYRFDATGKWDATFGTAGITRIDIAKEDDRCAQRHRAAGRPHPRRRLRQEGRRERRRHGCSVRQERQAGHRLRHQRPADQRPRRPRRRLVRRDPEFGQEVRHPRRLQGHRRHQRRQRRRRDGEDRLLDDANFATRSKKRPGSNAGALAFPTNCNHPETPAGAVC